MPLRRSSAARSLRFCAPLTFACALFLTTPPGALAATEQTAVAATPVEAAAEADQGRPSTSEPGSAGAPEPAASSDASPPDARSTPVDARAAESSSDPGDEAPATSAEPDRSDTAPEGIPARDLPVGAVPADEIPTEETPAGAISADEVPAEATPGDTQPTTAQTIGEALGTEGSELDRVETQIEAREFDAAARWLEAHLVEIERDTHRYDPALVRPLVLLGDASMGRTRYVEALQHYQRATHLARVNAGLKSLDQVPIVYREAAAYKALGQYEEANDREEYAYQILSANMGPNDLELLPALYRLAEWYLATGNAFAARGLYERAIRTYEGNGQGETEAAIPALQGLANTYRLERFPSGYAASQQSAAVAAEMDQPMTVNNFPAGEAALQKVVRIRQQTPDGDPMPLVEAVLDLADWYTLFEKPQRANPLYAHAFESMGQIADADRVAYFAQPRLLYVPDPGTPRRRPVGAAGEALRGFVEVGFSVTQNGYVRDLVTIASEPPELMDVRVRRSLRVARYRPALVDGVPVASTNQKYRHEFPYWMEPEEESVDKSEGKSAATQDQGEQE